MHATQHLHSNRHARKIASIERSSLLIETVALLNRAADSTLSVTGVFISGIHIPQSLATPEALTAVAPDVWIRRQKA